MFSSRLSAVLLCQISYLHLFHCKAGKPDDSDSESPPPPADSDSDSESNFHWQFAEIGRRGEARDRDNRSQSRECAFHPHASSLYTTVPSAPRP